MKNKVLLGLIFLLTFTVVSAYPITGESIEMGNESINAGITPDSIFYGLDVALDNINYALISKDKKSEKGLEIARERLLEIKEMISENKIEESFRAQSEHQEILNRVRISMDDSDSENITEEIEEKVKLEKEIEEHKVEIEETRDELKLKIKIEGEIDEETQRLIDLILLNLENSTGEIEIEIERKKEEIKIKIKSETEKSDEEIEQKFEDIRESSGLSNFEKERAEIMLERANNKWIDLEEKAIKYNQTIPDKEIFNDLIALGDEALLEGLNELAKDYYEDAKDYAEDLKESFEDIDDEMKEDEIEVEVEVKNGYSEIKVEAFGEKVEFRSTQTEREMIVAEIAERTGLSVEEINSNLEFEIDDDDDEVEGEMEGDEDREMDDERGNDNDEEDDDEEDDEEEDDEEDDVDED